MPEETEYTSFKIPVTGDITNPKKPLLEPFNIYPHPTPDSLKVFLGTL
jgi:hypothetical protein